MQDSNNDDRLAAAKARCAAIWPQGIGTIFMMAGKDRAKKCRDRKRNGLVRLEFDADSFTVIDGLIRRRMISDEASRNKKALNAAAVAFLIEQLKKV